MSNTLYKSYYLHVEQGLQTDDGPLSIMGGPKLVQLWQIHIS